MKTYEWTDRQNIVKCLVFAENIKDARKLFRELISVGHPSELEWIVKRKPKIQTLPKILIYSSITRIG